MNDKSKNKNIILLSDGTGNSNIKDRGTNVYKLYEALDFNGLHGSQIKQVAFYDDGVGTEELKPLKILCGAFGWGLARNVRNQTDLGNRMALMTLSLRIGNRGLPLLWIA